MTVIVKSQEIADLNATELAEHNAQIIKDAESDARFTQAEAKHNADGKSGYDKLITLGLTAEEIFVLTGYSVPVEE